jgi:hypothetical protein
MTILRCTDEWTWFFEEKSVQVLTDSPRNLGKREDFV